MAKQMAGPKSPNSLKKPPEHQGVDRRRNRASEGRNGEDGTPEQKCGPAAQPIAQRSENDLTDCESGHEKTKNQCGRGGRSMEGEADIWEGGETRINGERRQHHHRGEQNNKQSRTRSYLVWDTQELPLFLADY